MTEVLIPLMAGVGLYATYVVLQNRTRLMEQEVAEDTHLSKNRLAPRKTPLNVFTAYVDPATALHDKNTEEYTLAIAREGATFDGNFRQDLRSGHGLAPVAGIY